MQYFTCRSFYRATYMQYICIARYMIWPGVSLSVCPSHTGCISKRLNESGMYSAHRLSSNYPALYSEEIWVTPKIKVLSSRTFSQTLNLADFSALSVRNDDRRRCCQLRLTVASLPQWAPAFVDSTFAVTERRVVRHSWDLWRWPCPAVSVM